FQRSTHLAPLIRVRRRSHPVRLEPRITHPGLERGLRDPKIADDLSLRDSRLHKRDRVALELVTELDRHTCHPSSTASQLCGLGLNQSFSRPVFPKRMGDL